MASCPGVLPAEGETTPPGKGHGNMKLVTVFGGTGFLGRYIVEGLAREGVAVRIAVRHPDRAVLHAAPDGGQITSMVADVRDEGAVAAAVAGADGVVNAVSAYVEQGGITYRDIHERGAGNIARACNQQDVQCLVHISGIGADPASTSRYIGARGRGDLVVRQAFPRAVILRPSVMFGPDDAFLNVLAKIIRLTPVIPLIGGGRTRLQPIHVLDVAEAARRSLLTPGSEGHIYELGGAETYTLRGNHRNGRSSHGASTRVHSGPIWAGSFAGSIVRVTPRCAAHRRPGRPSLE
jgi:uncharacterized protein YbjT (DUF2867 family)